MNTGWRAFLEEIRETPTVTVGPFDPQECSESEAKEAIETLDQLTRVDLAFDTPRLAFDSAVWAARVIYRGCQFLVYRELDSATIETALSTSSISNPTPDVIYSVDLYLKYMPGLYKLAYAASPDDTLTRKLQDLALQWPLSSVGIPGLENLEADGAILNGAILEDACLTQLYVDRILAREDRSRLSDPRVLDAVRATLGGHPELCPESLRSVIQ